MKGRPKTTGKYQTRRELEEAVRGFNEDRRIKEAQIACICCVSPTTVANILRRKP